MEENILDVLMTYSLHEKFLDKKAIKYIIDQEKSAKCLQEYIKK